MSNTAEPRLALVENIGGVPVSITSFPLTPEGRCKAVEHAVDDATVRHGANPDKIRKELVTKGDAIIDNYGYHICRIDNGDC